MTAETEQVEMTCSDCGTIHMQTATRRRSHGTLCVTCTRKHARESRARREAAGKVVRGKMPPEYHREYSATYRKQEHSREADRIRAQLRRQMPEEQAKNTARRAVRSAIAAGTLTRLPCEVCGNTAQAHHDDYSQPLSVRWLCPIHHNETHRKARGGE